MIDDKVVLTAERLRDGLAELKSSLRQKYSKASRQVTAEDLRKEASRISEVWLTEITSEPDLPDAIGSDYLADLGVAFQRLLTYSEHATLRSKYDTAITAILKDFTAKVVIPLKHIRNRKKADGGRAAEAVFVPSAFLGHSFARADEVVVDCVTRTLATLGIDVVTGKKPKADRISEKVKRLIEGQHMFVGLFTRADKIARKKEWTTSMWVVDEKAYAVGKKKRLILLKEEGVGSIGGLQGDYEYISFSRDRLEEIVLSLLQMFKVSADGLQE